MPKKAAPPPQPEQSLLLSALEACKLLGVKPKGQGSEEEDDGALGPENLIARQVVQH